MTDIARWAREDGHGYIHEHEGLMHIFARFAREVELHGRVWQLDYMNSIKY